MLLDAICTNKDDLIQLFEAVFGHSTVSNLQIVRKTYPDANRSSTMSNQTQVTLNESEYIRASRIMNDPIEKLIL